jgi:hypothetical protein
LCSYCFKEDVQKKGIFARGQDLGVVQHACITQEEARTLLAKYGEEQYKWLMMFS